MNLNSLIKACKKQDRSAQSELYTTYKDTLFTLCLKYCKNLEEAEDNLQEAFITIFNKIKTYTGKGNFEGWMKRITINKAIDRYKKDSFINVMIKDDLLEDDTNIETSKLNLPLNTIIETIQTLPSRYRLVFNLYELDGYTHKEISEMLDISQGTSKSNLHRAKLILKEKINTINNDQTNTVINHGK